MKCHRTDQPSSRTPWARWLLFSILFLAFTASATADSQQYLMGGISRDSTYFQDGTGVWNNRTADLTTRLFTKIQSYYPLVGDVDNDSINEIIIIADDNLVIMNFTEGIGFITEYSLAHGNTSTGTTDFYLTPSLFDYDSDNVLEIVSYNMTEFVTYDWNGTTIVPDLNTTTSLSTTAVTLPSNLYPVIKCAPGTQWASGNNTCILIINNRTGAVQSTTACRYDIDNNDNICTRMFDNPNTDNSVHNTHVADLNGDGLLEAVWSYEETANGDQDVYVIELNTTGQLTPSLVYTQNQPAGYQYTDVTVSDIDGNPGTGLEISWFYQSGGQPDYEAITIRRDGTLVSNAYFLNNPEGDQLSSNNVFIAAGEDTINNFFGTLSFPSVCAYIRSYDNTDVYACISEYSGSNSGLEDVFSVTNFTRPPVIHRGNFAREQSLLTPRSVMVDSGLLTNPTFAETDIIIPVDYQINGNVDFIGMNSSRIIYYNDLYTNQQVVISTFGLGTGTPVCQFVTERFRPTVTDAEGDASTCWVEERLLNGSKIRNSTNASFVAPNTVELLLYLNVTGNFQYVTTCTDQFHNSGYAEYSTIIAVSNDTLICHQQDQAPITFDLVINTNASSDAQFQSNIDQTLTNMGVSSPRARLIVWLAVMFISSIFITAALAMVGAGGVAILLTLILANMATLLIGFYLGFVGAVVLVMVGLILAFFIVLGVIAGMMRSSTG